ncbi:unnamed protein product, partial [Meganyctiphanes norvegica]
MGKTESILFGPKKKLNKVESFEELVKVSRISYSTRYCNNNETIDPEDARHIGVVDSFYAMQEVELKTQSGHCQIKSKDTVVLNHRVNDVIICLPIGDKKNQVLYVTRSESYGRAAVLLQMVNDGLANQLINIFFHAVPDDIISSITNSTPTVNKETSPVNKDAKRSFGKGLGKKMTSIFSSLNISSGRRTVGDDSMSPRSTPTLTRRPVRISSSDFDGDNNIDDEDSTDDESIEEEIPDIKANGQLYEGLGLDSQKVQESLYATDDVDQPKTPTASKSDTQAAIDAEMKFFLDFDRNYVETLQSLEKDREYLARKETPQFIREKLTLLFRQIKALTSLHTELHEEFKQAGNNLQELSEAIVTHQEDYENHIFFMENIPTVDDILQNYSDYFKANIPRLAEKLRSPRMRLHYYVLTLESLQKKTTDFNETNALQKAMDTLKAPLKKADSKLLISAIIGSPFDLGNCGSLALHHDLYLTKGGDLIRATYHVLFLESVIVLTVTEGRYYRYVTSLRLDQVDLGKEERGVFFNINCFNGLRGQCVPYKFKAKNIHIQQLWIKELKRNLSNQIQATSPRTSLVDGKDSEYMVNGKRKITRIRSLKEPYLIQTSVNNIEYEKKDDRAGRTEYNTSWSQRRAALKKNSTARKERPILKKMSSETNDSDINIANIKNNQPPLSIWKIFPDFYNLYNNKYSSGDIVTTTGKILGNLLEQEKKYTQELNKQLGTFLDDDFPRPPKTIFQDLRHLYEFHDNNFLPALLRAFDEGHLAVYSTFINYSEHIIELYSTFLINRCSYDKKMQEMDLRNPYVYPALHFLMYLKAFAKIKCDDVQEFDLLEAVRAIFHNCIFQANLILLENGIDGVPFDLHSSGNVLIEGRVKGQWQGQVIKQDCHLVLMNTMILILEEKYSHYQYVEAIRMDTVGLGPFPDIYTFSLEVRTGSSTIKTYRFRTPRKDMRNQWVKGITDILQEQAAKLKIEYQKRMEHEPVKATQLEATDVLPDKDIPISIGTVKETAL